MTKSLANLTGKFFVDWIHDRLHILIHTHRNLLFIKCIGAFNTIEVHLQFIGVITVIILYILVHQMKHVTIIGSGWETFSRSDRVAFSLVVIISMFLRTKRCMELPRCGLIKSTENEKECHVSTSSSGPCLAHYFSLSSSKIIWRSTQIKCYNSSQLDVAVITGENAPIFFSTPFTQCPKPTFGNFS